MKNEIKFVIFSDFHYIDDNHKEKTNRKPTNLAIPVLQRLIDEINQNIKPGICVISNKKIFKQGFTKKGY